VVESYVALMGESLAAGLPGMIIRLAGCNLNCAYCDTPYAREEEGEWFSTESLVDAVLDSGLGRALITGGEPLLQPRALGALLKALPDAGVDVLVETNGTLPLNNLPAQVVKVVDVKTPGARAGGEFLTKNLQWLTTKDQLKFVMVDRRDYDWACRFLHRHAPRQAPGNILFSPAFGRLPAEQLAEWMLKDRLPFRCHLQLHKLIWGDRRGV